MKAQQLPVWNNRELVGHASSVAGAIKLVRRTHTIHPKMTVRAWRRPEHLQEILSLPDGFVFSISYDWN